VIEASPFKLTPLFFLASAISLTICMPGNLILLTYLRCYFLITVI
jgi:hypothetical protein